MSRNAARTIFGVKTSHRRTSLLCTGSPRATRSSRVKRQRFAQGKRARARKRNIRLAARWLAQAACRASCAGAAAKPSGRGNNSKTAALLAAHSARTRLMRGQRRWRH